MVTKSYGAISYELADLGTRFTALFIDGLILFVVESISFFSMRGIGVGAGASFLIGLAYTWFFLARNNGQTPGKMIMKIRVIKADGSPLTDGDAVARYFGYFINNFLLIGWLWAFADDNRQGWHDKIARTYVVKAE